MIEIERVTSHEYSMIFDGNKGEEQLVITRVAGMNGFTTAVVVAAQVCAVAELVVAAPLEAEIPTPEFPEWVKAQVAEWCGVNELQVEVASKIDAMLPEDGSEPRACAFCRAVELGNRIARLGKHLICVECALKIQGEDE